MPVDLYTEEELDALSFGTICDIFDASFCSNYDDLKDDVTEQEIVDELKSLMRMHGCLVTPEEKGKRVSELNGHPDVILRADMMEKLANSLLVQLKLGKTNGYESVEDELSDVVRELNDNMFTFRNLLTGYYT